MSRTSIGIVKSPLPGEIVTGATTGRPGRLAIQAFKSETACSSMIACPNGGILLASCVSMRRKTIDRQGSWGAMPREGDAAGADHQRHEVQAHPFHHRHGEEEHLR